MEVHSVHKYLGAIIEGVDASAASSENAEELKVALGRHHVVVLRDQKLTPATLTHFASLFGKVETAVREQFWHPEVPQVYIISNIVENGRQIGNPNDGFGWHTDQTVMRRPTAYTFLYCIEGPPEGADTQFVQTYDLHDALTAEQQAEYAATKVQFSHDRLHASRPNAAPLTEEQRRRAPDVVHPLVRTHPITGRKSIYLGRPTYASPIGLPEERGAALLQSFFNAATTPERVYSHRWKPEDLVIWDNRGTLHTATAYDKEKYRRLMHRVSVAGEEPC